MAAGRQSLAERRERGNEHHPVLGEAPVLVDRPGAGVRGVHLEVEMVDPLPRELLDHRAHERCGDAFSPRLRHDVEIRQPAETRRAAAREREPDRTAVLLGDESEARLDDLADLRELARLVLVGVRGRRHLVLEREPLLPQEGQVGRCRGADVHGA